ncbi:PP2C family protein-serine/threonine phosphatase [Streptomyces sp. HNM0574]|uniref:PP2C family protein-serine/threonine phosphatase n=1 Tax=Streptomyces sp. HNM0574 TaxID=2714954 RepID=UPI00146B2324|nr:PP2C family protein-serine/threonine phosphatase [Streptomyces sp. HNM0574]NLU69432.1 serine/threonine-protein phosphatase [Streptomyces sp. HNM0574]
MAPGRDEGGRRRTRMSRLALLMPLALIAAVLVVDVQAPATIHLGPFLAAAPALTAAFAGPWVTGAISLVSLAALGVISQVHGGLFTPNHQAQIIALLLISVLVVLFCAARERRRRELHRARSLAEIAQQALIRPLPRTAGPLRLGQLYVAADAEAQVGGDLYGAVRGRGATRLLIGDVRGKGLTAVNDAALLLGAFRATAGRWDLDAVVAHLEATARHAAGGTDDGLETFATALALEIDDESPTLHLVQCGHPQPLLVRGRSVTVLECEPGLPLGLNGLAGEEARPVHTFPFGEGDMLVLCTDGILEARDAHGSFYPLADRIARWQADDGPDSLIAHVHTDLLAHVGGQLTDDAALVVIAR